MFADKLCFHGAVILWFRPQIEFAFLPDFSIAALGWIAVDSFPQCTNLSGSCENCSGTRYGKSEIL